MLRTVITICTMLLISLILLTSLCHASPETSSPLTLNPQAGAQQLRENKHWPYITFDKETREQLLQANAGEKQIPAGKSTISRSTLLEESQQTWSHIIHLLETTQSEPEITTALIDKLYRVVTGNDLPADHKIIIRFLFPMQNFDVIRDYQDLYTWLSKLPCAEYKGDIYGYYNRDTGEELPINGELINNRIRLANYAAGEGIFTEDIVPALQAIQNFLKAPEDLQSLKNLYVMEQVASLLDSVYPDLHHEAKQNYLDITKIQYKVLTDHSDHLDLNLDSLMTSHRFHLNYHEQFSFTLLRPASLFPKRDIAYIRNRLWNKFNRRVKNITSEKEYIEYVADLSWDMYHLQLFPGANKRMAHFLSAYLLLAYNIPPPTIDTLELISAKKDWREHVLQNRQTKELKERWAKDVQDVHQYLKTGAFHEHGEL